MIPSACVPSPLPYTRLLVPTYRHRRIHGHHIALFYQQLPCLVAEFAHLGLWYGSTSSKFCDGPRIGVSAVPPHISDCRVLLLVQVAHREGRAARRGCSPLCSVQRKFCPREYEVDTLGPLGEFDGIVMDVAWGTVFAMLTRMRLRSRWRGEMRFA